MMHAVDDGQCFTGGNWQLEICGPNVGPVDLEDEKDEEDGYRISLVRE